MCIRDRLHILRQNAPHLPRGIAAAKYRPHPYWDPVSYTHLDVYKRQMLRRYGEEGRRLARLARGIDARQVSADRETKSCLLYTS